ncbi:UNVERIFIED_CONTAM: hypothetical protein POX90_26725, partial [Escherichia coli]
MVDQHFTQRISQRVDNLLRCRRAHAEPSFDCGNINAPSNAKQLSTFDQARESSLHSMARTMMQESARCQNPTFWKLLNDVQDFLGKSLHCPVKPREWPCQEPPEVAT